MPYRIAERDGKYCVIKEGSDEAVKCYRLKSRALRLLRALYANVEDANLRADKEANAADDRDEIYRRYHELVNMSASELERWADSECSKKASLSRAPIKRNLHLLRTPKEKWGEKEIRWAKRTISFIERMRGMEQGEPAVKGCPSKRDISLMNWAYRPSAARSDIRAFEIPVGARCVRSRAEDQDEIVVLAMPYNVVDSFNTYFSADTDIRSDITPEHQPVFDAHGLRGDVASVQPIGHVIEWFENEDGRWARVKLDKSHPRFNDFMQAAADCRLGASVGMLRAGMFPQPPQNGVYDLPTLLLQAPIVELSLIIEGEGIAPSNPAAFAGIDVRTMCKDCQSPNSIGATGANDEMAELRSQIESLRSELAKVALERDEAIRAINEFNKQKRKDEFVSRMSAMGVPQSVIDELMGIFDDVAEGSHDKLISAVGRMVDHMRASSNSNPSLRGDAQRAAAAGILTRQIATLDQGDDMAGKMVDRAMIEKDIAEFRRMFTTEANR